MDDDLLTQLETVLDTERAALLGARYDTLGQIGQDKARLIARMPQTTATRQRAESVLARMRHNQALVSAALSGLRGVGPHFLATGFQSYGEDGRRAAMSAHPPGFERRA